MTNWKRYLWFSHRKCVTIPNIYYPSKIWGENGQPPCRKMNKKYKHSREKEVQMAIKQENMLNLTHYKVDKYISLHSDTISHLSN